VLGKAALGRLLDYTVWANHRILRPVATLTVAAYRRDLGGSHGGVRGTLTHIMGAEWLWLERFKGVSPSRLLDESEFPDVVALRDRWKVIEDHRAAWFVSLREADAQATIAYRNLEGKQWSAPLWQLVQHVVNHSSYHRGQVTNFLRQLGARPVGTDMVAWDREREAKAKRKG
jgi:uncharacterized damage-inducible protein DinB